MGEAFASSIIKSGNKDVIQPSLFKSNSLVSSTIKDWRVLSLLVFSLAFISSIFLFRFCNSFLSLLSLELLVFSAFMPP